MEALDQRLKKLEEVARLLEEGKSNIYEAGNVLNGVTGQITGVHGNPNHTIIAHLNMKIQEIRDLAMQMRREQA